MSKNYFRTPVPAGDSSEELSYLLEPKLPQEAYVSGCSRTYSSQFFQGPSIDCWTLVVQTSSRELWIQVILWLKKATAERATSSVTGTSMLRLFPASTTFRYGTSHCFSASSYTSSGIEST